MIDDGSKKEVNQDLDQGDMGAADIDATHRAKADAPDMPEDEYQFENLDGLSGGEAEADIYSDTDFTEDASEGVASAPNRGRFDNLDPALLKTLRKGAFVVGIFVVVTLLYKYTASFFTSPVKTTPKVAEKVQPDTATQPKVEAPVQQSLPIYNSASVSSTAATTTPSQVTAEQQRLQREVSALQNQVDNVSVRVNAVADKMDDLKQSLLILNERLEKQSEQMSELNARVRAHASAERVRKKAAPRPVYHIQAIIPGRAWIISQEGQTLTVSRGTPVPGYGAVRSINPEMGRVFTSSGRVIQFSQADS